MSPRLHSSRFSNCSLHSPNCRTLARLIALALPMASTSALAMTFTVNTLNDTVSGNTTTGSLRDGLIAINASSDASNLIQFQAALNGTINLGSPLPLILNNVVIDGSGAVINIDGGSTYRIFFVGVDAATQAAIHTTFPATPLGNPIQVTLRNLLLIHGNAQGGNGGGGGMGAGGALFVNSAAAVTLDGVDLEIDQATGGNGLATTSAGSHNLGGGGGLGGSGGKSGSAQGGGGGIFGNGGSGYGAGGGGVFGNGGSGLGPSGGGGYTSNGGYRYASGNAGARLLAGISGSGGNGTAPGGTNGGGGGGGHCGGNCGQASSGISGGGGGFGGGNGNSTDAGTGGFGGGGGGGTLAGGNGGFGGGGGAGIDDNFPGNAPKGFGGFGGGGSTSNAFGGAGGFGGGGADGYGGGGAGGFGGGGGAGHFTGGTGGNGGFGGGNGAAQGGGGGAGFGGAVFVVGGGSLSLAGGSMLEVVGTTSAGTSGGGSAGSHAGDGLFLQGSGTLESNPAAGSKQSMLDSIVDETGSGIAPPSGYVPGAWGLKKDGLGILLLEVTNLYTGPTLVNAGVLRADGALNTSPVTVAAAGILSGIGEFPDVTSAGTLVPGLPMFPQANFAVDNTLTLQSGALSCFHAGGSPLTSSLITVFGTANLNGVARVDFATAPAVGDSFTLINGGTVNATFNGFVTNNPGVDGRLDYTGAQVKFVVTATDGLFRDEFEGGNNDAPCAAALVP